MMIKTSLLTWSTQLSTQADPYDRGLSHSKTIHPKVYIHAFIFYVITHYVCEILCKVSKKNEERCHSKVHCQPK